MDFAALCIMQLATRLVYTRPTHTHGRRSTCGHPSKPIFLKLFQPRTGLAKVVEATCPNCGQFSEKFLFVYVYQRHIYDYSSGGLALLTVCPPPLREAVRPLGTPPIDKSTARSIILRCPQFMASRTTLPISAYL